MDKLADKLTRYIIEKGLIIEEEYEIYRYGMLTGLEMTLCMAICTVMAIHLKAFLEFIVLIAVFFSLRAYVGGIHLKHFSTCLLCSCITIVIILIIAHTDISNKYVYLGISIIELLLVSKLAPSTTKDRVNDKDEAFFFAKQRMKILIAIAIVDVLFTILNMKEFISLIMYTLSVVLLSMVLGVLKKWMEVKRRQ